MEKAPDLFAFGIPLFMLLFLIEIVATRVRNKGWVSDQRLLPGPHLIRITLPVSPET